MMFRTILVFLSLVATTSQVRAVEPPILTGRASVIDGDTVEIHGQRIRLHGIDAPESGQLCIDENSKKWRCGQKSALALDALIGRKSLSCHLSGKDNYGRYIGICYLGNIDANAWMVRKGWAVAYEEYSQQYIGDERFASSSALGIWKGDFVRPDRWRKGDRLAKNTNKRATAERKSCSIKGNISNKGTRIYHLPGMTWYGRTQINEQKGERWFCSEADAMAAGWRKAR